jgi:hypothetical protein
MLMTVQVSNDDASVLVKFENQEIRLPLSGRLKEKAVAGELTLHVNGSAQEGAVITFGPPSTVTEGGTFYGSTGYSQCFVVIPHQSGIPVSTPLIADFNVDIDGSGGHHITVSNIRSPNRIQERV